MSLIVAGATGAIGRCVVREALRRAEFTQVVALTRSSVGKTITPGTTLTGIPSTTRRASASDVEKLFGFKVSAEEGADLLTATQLERLRLLTFDWELFCNFWAARRDKLAGGVVPTSQYVGGSYESAEVYYTEVFSGHKYAAMCLGTTRRDAGSAAAFERCDYEYVVNFAEALEVFSGNTLSTYAQVSSHGANEKSWFLYMKTKGKADAAVEALQFPRICIYRPGVLDRGDKSRFNEKMIHLFTRGIPVEVCGRAIVSDFVHCGSKGSDSAPGTASWKCAGKEVKPALSNKAKSDAQVFVFSNDSIKIEAAGLV
ncbi:uncharacterized protein TM35_000272190 [Trypanosoma theileri]|uniref:NAD(P)-binding domain-containing protein n=1 Tax=Trypanosoma theileri TaxID=67003 RepID=A0A1X0NR33_9TRYP|nr:uncharacterized protein TM35_000272190 [Trypanosoma theileri]ORC86629.1 hypothetical protein TM35_000272190 [Trypanosoma theileri]